ncbi:hypothetical protein X801_07837, partial [Opisthorchis viverrini]
MFQLQPHPNRLKYQCGMTPPKGISSGNTPLSAKAKEYGCLFDFDGPPRFELTKFDGSSHDYLKFIRQFEFYVESRTTDDGQSLLCLLPYCRGRAREAIEECTSHCVARSLLDGLHKRFRALWASPADLLQLTTKLENCEISLKQMGYGAHLNFLLTLKRLARCLPVLLQQKWAEYADGVTKDEREPAFRYLRNFTDIRARISNSRFGTIANQTNKCRAAQTTLPKQPIKRQHSLINAVFKLPESGPLYREPHPLTNCVKFADLECNKRWDVAKRREVCFRCLKSGHVTKACKTERKCRVSECKTRHHYLLHTTPNPSRSVQGICNTANARQGSTALGLLPVRIKGPLGKLVVYALLDNGSDATLVRHDVLRRLGIPPHPSQLIIETINCTCLSESCVENLEIGSQLDSTWVNIDKAFVVPGIVPSVNVGSR